MALTPAQQAAADQGSIDAANKANVAAGLVKPADIGSFGEGKSSFVDPNAPKAPVAPAGVSKNPNNSAAVTAAQATQTQQNGQASTLANNNGTSNSAGFISTSDSVQNTENNIANTVNTLSANNQGTTDAHNTYIATIQQQMDALEARRLAAVAGIGKDFDSQKSTLDGTQKSETGQESVITQRSGGYLGAGASQLGAMISLSQTHATEQAQLESKRQAAIQAAQNAIDDKEFALANAQAQEAKDYQAAMQKNKQDYLDNQLKLQKAQQDAVTFAQDQAKNSLTALSSLTSDQLKAIDPKQLSQIDEAYGVQGFAQNYLAATAATNAAKSASDVVDAQQKMLNLLQDIPKGQKVTFPDPSNPGGPGITYTGMGSTGDITTFSEVDNAGRITILSYDKTTNTVTRTAAGSGGKTSASSAADSEADARLKGPVTFFQKVGVPADPADLNSPKLVTASDYVATYQNYIKLHPSKGPEFISTFPLQETVLPSQLDSAQSKLKLPKTGK